ncbi:MAG: TetR family transcriptional regulator [Aeromonadales bacterium]|nr:TetR family transcriptional regulator [Aeromonadales bacterium]MDY2891715.1 TetR family transcriptional regulator [Succinivibrio sp.]
MSKKTHEESLKTRQAILDSAMRLFSRRGFERTSLSDIAKYAGVTRGAIYWHFEDKGHILVELCESIAQENHLKEKMDRAASPEEDDPLGRLREWLLSCGDEASIRFYCSAVFALIENIWAGTSGDEATRNRIIKFYEQRRGDIREALKNAVRKKQLRSGADIDLAEDCISMFLCGFVDIIRLGGNDKLTKHYKVLVNRVIDDLMTL